jgi:hypothetical protein
MRALAVEARRPSETIRLGEESLLKLTMKEASELYGVSNALMGRRLRQDKKRKGAAA